ncbi:MAG: UvrD-helicase domain-containing protein, partial [Candidatus Aerophobetes bacterium]
MRREEALSPGKSAFVSSPAGSGKTQLLAERYVKLLEENLKNKRLQEYSKEFAGKALTTENILSITFTRKAAFEMRERVFELLLTSKSEKLRKIGQELLEHPERIRISTIHSFCHSLLRRFSLEASLDPEFDIIG